MGPDPWNEDPEGEPWHQATCKNSPPLDSFLNTGENQPPGTRWGCRRDKGKDKTPPRRVFPGNGVQPQLEFPMLV